MSEPMTDEELEAADAAEFESGFTGEDASVEVADELEEEAVGDDEPEAPEPEAPGPDVGKLETRLRNVEGKFGTLNASIQRLATAAEQQATRAGAESPTKAEAKEALHDSTKMQALKDEFPEWAEAMEEQIGAARSSILKEIPDVEALRESLRAEAVEEVRKELVEDAHPGWVDTVKTMKFGAWLEDQPEDVRALATSDRPRDAIKLLDRFAEQSDNRDTGSVESKAPDNRRRLQDAVPATRSGSTNRRERTSSEEEDFIRAFNGN